MRRNRLKDLDTVYLLGAGASYASSLPVSGPSSEHTTPLDITFIERLLELSPRARKPWITNSQEKLKINWIGGGDITSLGLEEALYSRLGNYELLKAIHPIRLTGNSKADSKCDNYEYMNHVSHLIVELLNRCKQNTRKYSDKFAKHVFGSKEKRNSNRLITFNYDTLIDDYLLDKIGLSHKKVYFDRLKDDQSAGDYRRSSDRFHHPLLIKLHGSTNWRVESNDFKSIVDGVVDPIQKIPIWIDRKKCPDPEDDTSPLILPPLPNKPITGTSIFRYLWQCAFEYLHEARKLVIAGYSCPLTDSHAMSMLSQVYNRDLEHVVIVDKDGSVLNKYRELLQGRIAKNSTWTYYGNFVDYVKSL